MSTKIFISHSSADEELASALVDCLFSSIVLEDEDVRCTSVPGHKLPVGAETATVIRDELDESAVVIGLITRNAVSSSWVLFELGATWGANKNLLPLVADEVAFSELPGPLTGHHAAKLSDKSDVTQFVEEITKLVGAQSRTQSKIAIAVEKLVAEHARVGINVLQPENPKNVLETIKEPTIAGMPHSELAGILQREKVIVPAVVLRSNKDSERSVFDLFVSTYESFGQGLQSNWERDTGGGFLYHSVAMKLLPYGLVKFEKLPAAQAKWFKRVILSPDGQKFITHVKRLIASMAKD